MYAPYHVTYAQGANFSHIFEIVDPDLPTHWATCISVRFRYIELSPKIVCGPVLKTTQVSAHAHNYVSLE